MEDNAAADNLSVQASVSYTEPAIVQTDSGNQSVHTTVTHGTQGSVHTANTTNTTNQNASSSNPSSPHRGTTTTPLSMSPSSAAGHTTQQHQDFGSMEPMPQYSHPNASHPQHEHVWVQPNMAPIQQQQQQLHHAYPASRERSNPVSSEEDDHTEPSSSANTGGDQALGNNANDPATSGYTRSDEGATSTFGRLIQSATKGMNSRVDNRKDSADEEGIVEGALIYGYLQKLGRNGKWQTRWFETDGECLTYYKSSKRAKLLATLDLAKVGSIVMNREDEKECSFVINISERPYHLRADSSAACKDWVITLNRVKEARMHEGNVKLLMPNEMNQPVDLLDQSFTPRVVVVANRQRTHAVEDDDIASWEAIGGMGENTNPNKFSAAGAGGPPTSARLARWQKPKTSIRRFASKILAWARSIRKHGCQDAENHVVLDHHLHPPGHDDKVSRGGSTGGGSVSAGQNSYANPASTGRGQPHSNTSVGTDRSPNAWIGNQNSTDKSFPREVTTNNPFDQFEIESMNPPTVSPSADILEDDDDDDGARFLS